MRPANMSLYKWCQWMSYCTKGRNCIIIGIILKIRRQVN